MPTIKDNLTLKNQKGIWYPTPISCLESHFGVFIIEIPLFTIEKITPLKKNLAYNMQYIEFLDRLIKDIKLSSVLWKLNVKSFVIHSAAVVEGIFNYLVISKGYGKNNEWVSYKNFGSISYEINGDIYKQDTEILKKITPPILVEMTFDQMANKVENKHLLGNVPELYRKISRLRKLRNKIHLIGNQNLYDTDYHNFSITQYTLAREVLYEILTCSLFSASPNFKYFVYLVSF